MKIWSLLYIRKKYCGKEKKLLLRSNFFSFPQYFQYICNFKSPITHIFFKCGCSNYVFLNSANLLCRGTDISKYFRESLEIRDNESRLPVLGCLSLANYSVAYEETQSNRVSDFRDFVCSLFPKAILCDFYWLSCCVCCCSPCH